MNKWTDIHTFYPGDTNHEWTTNNVRIHTIGLIGHKWFLTIYAKYGSVKTYNEENSFFLEKQIPFQNFQIHHLHVCFDIIPCPDIRGAFKILQVHFYLI